MRTARPSIPSRSPSESRTASSSSTMCTIGSCSCRVSIGDSAYAIRRISATARPCDSHDTKSRAREPDMLAAAAIRTFAQLPARQPARDKMGLLAFPATVIQADRDEEIVAQSASLRHCLQVMEGCVRIVCLLEDGRRQITDFLFAGDVFGLDMLPGESLAAEAVTAVTLRRIPHAVIETRASGDLGFAQGLLAYGAAQVRAARTRCILLGRKTASERVSSFLL